MRANKKKLENLILYILQNYNNSNLTETKLQKLLYFCDFNHYYKTSQHPVTGYTYRKNHHGPTIMDLPKILEEMENNGIIKIIEGVNYYGNAQRTFSLITSEIKSEKEFEPEELLTIKEVNEAYVNLKPYELRSLSHLDFPYSATPKLNNVIDYDLVQYRADYDEELDADEEATTLFSSKPFTTLLDSLKTRL